MWNWKKLFFYSAKRDNEAQNKLIYFLKRNPNKRGFELCAAQLWNVLRNELEALGVDDIENEVFAVNMPRSKSSVSLYGFDQSAEICKTLSKELKYKEVLYGLQDDLFGDMSDTEDVSDETDSESSDETILPSPADLELDLTDNNTEI